MTAAIFDFAAIASRANLDSLDGRPQNEAKVVEPGQPNVGMPNYLYGLEDTAPSEYWPSYIAPPEDCA